MRTFRICLLILATLLFGLGACSPARESAPTATPLPLAFKGYELYTWPDQGDWRFALLLGTNRNKTLDEIMAVGNAGGEERPEVRGRGIEALKAALGRLSAGEQVFWSGANGLAQVGVQDGVLALPPQEIVAEVRRHADGLGIALHVSE